MVSHRRASFITVCLLLLGGIVVSAAQPVIVDISIPDASMKIGDVVTATITVQSDPAIYTLNASNIGGYALSGLSKQSDTSYFAEFTISSGGTDYAAAADIPTDITLADGGDLGLWNTPISQANDLIDANVPTDPTPTSSSHAVSVWDDDNTIDIQISGASDSGSGVDGFEIEWDQSATWTPSETKEQEETWSGATFTATSDGDWYFHIATVDNAGNWTSTEHLGPFQIDTAPPSVPTGLSPASGSTTSDTSPILSWSASTDTGGSGIRDTDAYRIVVTGPVNRDTYVSDTDYNPSLAEGTFTWKVYARDNAGNVSSYSADTTLVIDTTSPDVTINEAGAQDDPTNASPVVFTVVFDEPINDATFTNVDVSVGGTATTGTVTVTEVAPNDDTTFEVSIVVTADGTVVPSIPAGGVEDVAGNTNTVSTSTDNSVTYDATDPTDPTPSSSSHTVSVPSNDNTIDIGISGASDTGSGVDGFEIEWDKSATWTPTETKEQEENWAGATFTATSDGDWYFHIATVDNAGNWTSTQHLGPFSIDTDPPGVTVDIVDASLSDSDNSSLVTFEFDEDVQNFTIDDLTPTHGTLSSFITIDADSYTVVFTATDGIDATGSVAVGAGTYTDLVGNNGEAGSDTVDIDTEDPQINDLVLNDTLISESDTPGDGTLEIVILCSEAMDETITPLLIFDPTVASTLTWDSGGWDDSSTYRAYYDVADGDVEEDTVTIDVAGLRDLAGNEQQDMPPWFSIEIDTVKPSVSSVTVDTDPVYDGDLTQVVTVTFDEAMLDNGTADPSISFGSGSWTSNADGAYNGADTIWTETFTLTDSNQDVSNVTVDVMGAKDAAGNDQENYVAQAEFDINTLNPTVTSIVRADANPTNAASVDFTVTLSESVSGVTSANFSLDSTCGCETIDSVSGSGTTWAVTVLTADNEDYVVGIDLDSDLSSITDDAGNELEDAFTAGEEYEVDREDPNITTVLISRSGETLNDDFVGSELYVSIALDDEIDQTSIPSITFSADVSGTLTYDRVSWGTHSCSVYYTIGDGNEEIDGVGVWTISNVFDHVGNPVNNINYGTDEFDIDNENPSVSSVSFSPDLIADADDGSYFYVSISFDEDMGSARPFIVFVPGHGSTLSPYMDGWLGGSFTAEYEIHDRDVDFDSVTITITGAEDEHGNDMQAYTPEPDEWFEIDTENPTVAAVTVDDTLLSDSDAGTTLTVTVDFSENMTDDGSEDPALTFAPTVGSTLSFSSDSWPSATRYRAVYDISDAGVDVDSVTIDVEGAEDANGNDQQDYTPESEFEIDTLNPVVSMLTLSDDEITDADVGNTFTVTVDFSEDMIAGTVPSIVFSPNLDTTLQADAGSSGWTADDVYVFAYTILDGNVTVLDDDITISNAQDLAGNVQVIYNYNDQLDVDTENPYFHDFTVTGGAVDADCLRVVTFTAKVTDPNGTMVPGDITVTAASVTNTAAGITAGDVYDIQQTSDNQTTITITGKVDIEDLTDCPARVTITLDAVDSVDNDAAQQSQSDDVVDTTIPTIDDLRFDTDDTHAAEQTVPYLVDECGRVVVYFSATINDNCCIDDGNVTVDVTLPLLAGEGDAVLEDIDVELTQNGQNQVLMTGSAVVRCLESVTPRPNPAGLSRVQIDVAAYDCCGNDAVSVETGTGEGLVDDEILPIPRDDPRQDMVMDESAIADENLLLKVRLDEFGVYRLVLRENTPVRIDLLANDADNLTHNVGHPFGPCVACGPCGGQTGCCAEIFVYEIVQHPTFGTAEIIDDSGDCGGGSVIRFAPDRGYLGPDFFTYRIVDAFGNVSDVIATVYLQTVPEVWVEDIFVVACGDETTEFSLPVSDLFIDIEDPSRIPFEFEILAGPSHGVVTGSVQNIDYAPPSTVTDPQFGVQVPSLDFTETAILNMSYTPADGFEGRDLIRVQISDPFGGSAIAVVDFAVGACGPAAAGEAILKLAGNQILPMLLPGPVGEALMADPSVVLLRDVETGTLYAEALAIGWDEEARAYVLMIDGSKLPYDIYELVIPLDGGEAVTLQLEVGEAE